MENNSGFNFENNEPSKWSLIGFLTWRSKTLQFLDSTKEHSAFKSFIKEIATDENNTKAKKAQELFDKWKVSVFFYVLALDRPRFLLLLRYMNR